MGRMNEAAIAFVRAKIEVKRVEMHEAADRATALIDPEVVRISQELDELLNELARLEQAGKQTEGAQIA